MISSKRETVSIAINVKPSPEKVCLQEYCPI
jgi:hypothetical protein